MILQAILLFVSLAAAAPEDKLPPLVLPEGKGKAAVETHCTRCHSVRHVLQQAMDRAHWDRTITKMQVSNGLWELEPALRKEILDYLETFFSPKALDGMDDLGPRAVNPLPR